MEVHMIPLSEKQYLQGVLESSYNRVLCITQIPIKMESIYTNTKTDNNILIFFSRSHIQCISIYSRLLPFLCFL